MDEAEPEGRDSRLRRRYRRITVLLLIIAILFTAWTIAVVSAVFMLGIGGAWTVLTPTEWVIINIVVVVLFVFIDLFIFLRYRTTAQEVEPGVVSERRRFRRRKGQEAPAPAPATIHGHEVFTMTLPSGAKGGIFSKTFVEIDDHRVLQLRYQIIPSSLLWPPSTE